MRVCLAGARCWNGCFSNGGGGGSGILCCVHIVGNHWTVSYLYTLQMKQLDHLAGCNKSRSGSDSSDISFCCCCCCRSLRYHINWNGQAKFLAFFSSLNDLIAYIENEIDLTTILISQLNIVDSFLYSHFSICVMCTFQWNRSTI